MGRGSHTCTSSGSSGHCPGVDFLPPDLHSPVEMQVPLRVPTLQVLGAGGTVQHWEKRQSSLSPSLSLARLKEPGIPT